MNAMDLLTGPVAQALGWALLHLLWQATIVAGILAAVLALLPRESARARYAAACGSLMLVFALFIATAIRAYDPAAAPIPTAAPQGAAVDSIPLAQIPVVIASTAAASWRDRALDAMATARQSLPSVVALWFIGVVVLSARLLVSWFRTRALATRGATPAGAEWQRIAGRLSAALGLRRAVTLLESASVEVPSVIGTLKPVVLLPASALTGLTAEQIEMVLAHELAHIRRHDFLVNLLQAFVETLMFYHPAVWWMSRRVRIERENCCDDLAVAVCGDPIRYARALTRLEELRAGAPAFAVAANGGSLLDRIRRIAAERAESTGVSSRVAAGVATLALIALAMAVPSMPAFAQREDKPAEAPKAAQARVDVVETSGDEDDDFDPDPDIDVDIDADADIDVDPDVDVEIDPDIDVDYDNDFDFDFDDPAVPAVPAAPAAAPAPQVAPVPPVPAPAPAPFVSAALYRDDEDEDEREERYRERTERRSDRRIGDGGPLTVDELIGLRAVGVTPDYIREIRTVFPEVTVRQVQSLKAVGVTPAYVRSMRDAGLAVSTAKDATSLRAVGVTPEFVRDMRSAGFEVKSAKDATSLRAVGVTPEFVREMRSAGFEVKSAKDASSLRAVGVTPEFVREMRSAGFQVMSAKDATSLRAVGVIPEFVREMRDLGFDISRAKDATSLRAVGVNGEWVRAMRAAGVAINTPKEATSLHAVGVTPELVRKLADAGYRNLTVKELSRLAAHGVDDDFIREMQQYRDNP